MAEATVLVTTPVCQLCGNSAVVELTEAEVQALKVHRHIQDALPHRDDDFRELLISGTHAHCWETLFGGDED